MVTAMAGRVVVITGASSGIGLATALACAARGDDLVLVARGRQALSAAAESCRQAGAASVAVESADVSDGGALAEVASNVRQRHPRIDAVINSAGVVAYGRFENVPAEVFEQVVATNLLGSANVARTFLPLFRDENHGHLILLGSLIGEMVPPYMSSYTVSKWAVRALARNLTIENRDRSGVHITCVSPGGVDTPVYLQGANYLGRTGRPPPPIAPPEQVARAVIRVLEHPRARVNVGWTNGFVRAGFAVLPAVFDALVTPLFEIAALDQTDRREADTGNVLSSGERQNRLHGEQGNVALALAANLRARAFQGRRRSR